MKLYFLIALVSLLYTTWSANLINEALMRLKTTWPQYDSSSYHHNNKTNTHDNTTLKLIRQPNYHNKTSSEAKPEGPTKQWTFSHPYSFTTWPHTQASALRLSVQLHTASCSSKLPYWHQHLYSSILYILCLSDYFAQFASVYTSTSK